MGGCISCGLGIDGSAFQVSSWGLDCGFSCGGFQGRVSRSVLMRFGLVGLQYFFLGQLIYPHFVRYCKHRHIVNDICVLYAQGLVHVKLTNNLLSVSLCCLLPGDN